MKIRLGNKIVFETFNHYIYEYNLTGYEPVDSSLKMVLINKDNIDDAGNALGNTTRKWIESDYPYVEGYYFVNDDNKNIGSCWVMYKGGDEKLYRIRNHDSFIFRVQVEEQYRGMGYSKQIMHSIFTLLKKKGCTNTCLVCARKNKTANRLYESLGMNKIDGRKFIRLFNKNMPYHSI